jgi:hypothetical protein
MLCVVIDGRRIRFGLLLIRVFHRGVKPVSSDNSAGIDENGWLFVEDRAKSDAVLFLMHS